jgi:hypothetical protein
MPSRKFFAKHIVTPIGTTVVTAKSAYVNSVVITCSDAGGGFTLTIKDGAGNVIIPLFTPTVPVDGLPNVDRTFEEPQRARQGINIITAGTIGTGVADVQIACTVTEEG